MVDQGMPTGSYEPMRAMLRQRRWLDATLARSRRVRTARQPVVVVRDAEGHSVVPPIVQSPATVAQEAIAAPVASGPQPVAAALAAVLWECREADPYGKPGRFIGYVMGLDGGQAAQAMLVRFGPSTRDRVLMPFNQARHDGNTIG